MRLGALLILLLSLVGCKARTPRSNPTPECGNPMSRSGSCTVALWAH